MGRTPPQEGTWPVKRYHADLPVLDRNGRRGPTSGDDFRWYHQNDTGTLNVASLALVVKVDHALLSAVQVWHAHVVDVVANDIVCGHRCRHVCR
eukprot:4054220-Pleurochrysis_carterae.AAC.3